MRRPALLLLQVRKANDPMAQHEAECVRRRLGPAGDHLQTRNVLLETADCAWLQDADGLIIGGSGAYSVHDPRSAGWVGPVRDLLEAALADSMPGFGICFGHQLLGVHLGCQVVTSAAHAEVGTRHFHLTPAGARDPVTAWLPPVFRAQTGHSDCVTAVPESVALLATSPTLDTQLFRVRGTHFYSTQFHPDLLGQEARDRYEAYARALAESGAPAPSGRADAYEVGADDAEDLLKRWVEQWHNS